LHFNGMSFKARGMTHSERFIADVEAFLKRSGMSASRFSWEAVKDPNFVANIRAGRAPSLRLVDRVHEFISAQDDLSKRRA